MNYHVKIKGIKNCPVKSESAIMARDSKAVQPILWDYATGLKKSIGKLILISFSDENIIRQGIDAMQPYTCYV